jgi:hypothetical protein
MTWETGIFFRQAVIFLTAIMLFWSCSGNSLPEEGSPDEALFRSKCTVCHSWPHPGRHSAWEWDHYLKLMDTHMLNREISLEPEEKETIRAYLHRNARKD